MISVLTALKPGGTQSLFKQVCVQLATSADNVALPAFAAERRAAAPLLLTAGRAAIDQYLLPAGLTAASGVCRANDGTDGQTDKQRRTH